MLTSTNKSIKTSNLSVMRMSVTVSSMFNIWATIGVFSWLCRRENRAGRSPSLEAENKYRPDSSPVVRNVPKMQMNRRIENGTDNELPHTLDAKVLTMKLDSRICAGVSTTMKAMFVRR